MAINKIQVIAHPLYWFFDFRQEYSDDSRPKGVPAPIPPEIQPGEKAVIKMCTSNYGRVVNEVKNDPNQLLIIAGIDPERKTAETAAITKQYSRILNYAQKQLGRRLIIADEAMAISIVPPGSKLKERPEDTEQLLWDVLDALTEHLSKFDLEKNIEIITTGMYRKKGCVERCAKRLKYLLGERKAQEYFGCAKGCIKLPSKAAEEYNFICPKCRGELKAAGKNKTIRSIKTKIVLGQGALSRQELASFGMYRKKVPHGRLVKWKKKTFGTRPLPRRPAGK